MAIDLKAIDLKLLKVEIKVVNETGFLEKKIKVVGTSKENLVKEFKEAIHFLDDNEKDIPETAINFYNTNLSDEGGGDAAGDAAGDAGGDAGSTPDGKGKKKDKPTRKPPTATKKITSLEDIKERLKEPANPTAYMDSLMLKGGKIETLIAKLKEHLDDNKIDFSGFRTVSAVKRHIQYREEHGWVYDKDEEKGTVKVSGFAAKK